MFFVEEKIVKFSIKNLVTNLGQTVNINKLAKIFYIFALIYLQETLDKMMPRITQIQENVPVPNLQYFQLSNPPSNSAVPPAAEIILNAVHFKQVRICLHPRELLSEHVGDLDNQENFDPSSCRVVTELNENRDRHQKISQLFDQNLRHCHIRVRKQQHLKMMFQKMGIFSSMRKQLIP